jgi:hypothetical protein
MCDRAPVDAPDGRDGQLLAVAIKKRGSLVKKIGCPML